ncbi:ABC transporter permease [Novosphingobium mangrovi (ex Huang et al. 2023)]|uniref:ABC transporter permease n=1 Tax=Novosphingobium mangrovi (ex Huang et al. 2023) TaxID=2976432 RepID=A0ABT2I1X1_9SPHN|nr:ABC transporter permease [Novosphingobium mangrovi (ex Huang et al. 2023)]MCT2398796.1 ABC transporter permease [Novosphingobium mangrovi (ex Huang et al. 2023)]
MNHALVSFALNRQTTMFFVVVALFIGFAANSPHFLDSQTQFEILRITAFTLIIGLPLTYLVIAGEVDLSIGSNYGLCSVVTALAIVDWGWNPWLAALLAVGLGTLIGLFNGMLTVKLKVPSFILTIGMLSLLRGLALVITMGLSIDVSAEYVSSFFGVAGGKIGPVPAQVIWALAAFVISGFVLRYTLFGARLYATGGNVRAALQMGVNPGRIKIWTFTLVGFSCGLAGALTTGWLRIGSPNTGAGGELAIIAAVIIGGAALSGGIGTATGTLLGAIIVSMLQTGLILVGVQGNWVQVYVGLLIVMAAALEPYLRPDGPFAEWLMGLGRRTDPG